MEKDKTKLIDHDVTKLSEDDVAASSDPTIESKKYDGDQTVGGKGDSTTGDKTMLMFDKSDIQKKLQEELDEIPEVRPEDMHTGYLSKLISKPFAHRTEEERIKINRNFLRDAAPISLERLKEDIGNASEELSMGFPGLDCHVSIPNRKLTLIASRPLHGKTVFMLNMLLNMCRNYPEYHFIYYTYGESIQDIEIKLINISGDTPFSPLESEGINTNFKRWKYELKKHDINSLKEKADKDLEYNGLKKFLEISSRIHVIDANYNIVDLLDSIKAFNNTLSVGAIFIDYFQAIRPEKAQVTLDRHQQMQIIADQLIQVANETRFPLILGTQLIRGEKNMPEYDELALEYLQDMVDSEQIASLIIGLQNYSNSAFIGSNINNQFKSRFYHYTLKKPERMPETFKDKHPNSAILAKVLVNKGGPQFEVELLFNKYLMKISDSRNGNETGEV
jgi:hypothetical protein